MAPLAFFALPSKLKADYDTGRSLVPCPITESWTPCNSFWSRSRSYEYYNTWGPGVGFKLEVTGALMTYFGLILTLYVTTREPKAPKQYTLVAQEDRKDEIAKDIIVTESN
eukprot:CAMPEP_0168524882 /NCGR_PEP_ID=MMETSP0405-20121227/10945_1 /TAXON_ID=498012 /ORGANISM="Trichosphaerium sp, Strain Am-I-7 wt" /LENGTH=110 /DNA_ID=CAMNT_0008547235 /DNA_START=410 /DNA_END=742 /DNA_ORIENTATION=-